MPKITPAELIEILKSPNLAETLRAATPDEWAEIFKLVMDFPVPPPTVPPPPMTFPGWLHGGRHGVTVFEALAVAVAFARAESE